jgi:cob(I)alamin adenosyltransferase
MNLYTKTGDHGTTHTLGSTRLPKSHPLFEILGYIDHLNAVIGWVDVVYSRPSISRVQNWLFEIGLWICQCNGSRILDLDGLDDEIQHIEDEIDDATSMTPPLSNFVLPGGNEVASRLHIARTTARSVERLLWHHAAQPSNVHTYLNRLSDWCFALARLALHQSQGSDKLWITRNNPPRTS